MSDEHPENAPLTGMVHQPHGGVLNVGNQRVAQPTPNDVRDLCRKRMYQAIPELNRIARNKPTTKKRNPGPNKVGDQLRAIEILMRGANDETISASDLRRSLKGFSEAVLQKYPGALGEEILALAAPHFFSL